MKANFNTLKQALKICADAHKTNMWDWSEDSQLALNDDSIPVYSDVSMIAEAFFGTINKHVETTFGYTIINIAGDFLPEVNTTLLSLALPHGSVNTIIETDNDITKKISVKELIKFLQTLDQDKNIWINYDCGYSISAAVPSDITEADEHDMEKAGAQVGDYFFNAY